MKSCFAVLAVAAVIAAGPARAASPAPEIQTSDVDLFYRVYDATHGAPTAQALQTGYLDAGSDQLREFVTLRIKSADKLAAAIAARREPYDRARDCMAVLPAVKTRLNEAFRKLADLDPEAAFPPVTILIGRGNSGGTTDPSGVLIGLEVGCSSTWLQADPTDRLVHLITHEYGHIQQFAAGIAESESDTVLKHSLEEGVAELVAELASGEVSNIHLQRWTKGRERQIDELFLADQDSTDLSHWLYNGVGTPEKPGDLGYWVGWRIAKAYYLKAADKRAALMTLLQLKDAKAILAESGWTPGDPD